MVKFGGPSAVAKKRRTNETGNSVVTSTVQQHRIRNPHQKGNGKGQPRKINAPFSMIKVDEVKFADERLKDNPGRLGRMTTGPSRMLI